MRERMIVGPVLAFYWWIREYPTAKTGADLRFESRLWSFAGNRDMERLCRLEAQVVGAARPLELADVWACVAIAAGLALAVVLLVVQVVRWVL